MPKGGNQRKTWVMLERLVKPVRELDPTPAEWVPVRKTKVAVIPTGGVELIDGQTVASNITHNVECQYFADLHTSWRLKEITQGTPRIWNIDSIRDYRNYGNYLILRCVERPAPEPEFVLTGGNWIWQNDDDHTWDDGELAIFFGQ